MKISELEKLGGFIREEDTVQKVVKWAGKELRVFVRVIPFGEFEELFDEGVVRTTDLIEHAIRLGDHGDEKLTHEQARGLAPKLATQLAKAVNEVNAPDDNAKKK